MKQAVISVGLFSLSVGALYVPMRYMHNSLCTAQRYEVVTDALLSLSAKQAITKQLELLKGKPAATIGDMLIATYKPALVTIARHHSDALTVTIAAHHPVAVLNDTMVLDVQGNLHEKNRYTKKVVDKLALVTTPLPYSSRVEKFLTTLPPWIAGYTIQLEDEHAIWLSKAELPKVAFCIDAEQNVSLEHLALAKKIIEQKRQEVVQPKKQQPAKNTQLKELVADLRFDRRIIVYSR